MYSSALEARERRRTYHERHVAGLNGCINTLDHCVCIPTNKSEFSLSQRTRRLRDVIDMNLYTTIILWVHQRNGSCGYAMLDPKEGWQLPGSYLYWDVICLHAVVLDLVSKH